MVIKTLLNSQETVMSNLVGVKNAHTISAIDFLSLKETNNLSNISFLYFFKFHVLQLVDIMII